MKVLFDTNQLCSRQRKTKKFYRYCQPTDKIAGQEHCPLFSGRRRVCEPRVFTANNEPFNEAWISENEQAVANWVFKNRKHAGATTDTLSNAKCRYLAIRTRTNVYGVVGIVMEGNPPDAFANNIILSILGECALAMENEKNAKRKEEAAVRAENERLLRQSAPCHLSRFKNAADF